MKVSKKLAVTAANLALNAGFGYLAIRHPKLWEAFVGLGFANTISHAAYVWSQGKIDLQKAAGPAVPVVPVVPVEPFPPRKE